ncbi:unnamed protein product [Brachionus calyciflorus]|uniref:Uncharacterized protein n=1 Tax=Brachionus calyciflorus TaxID=104777 RepID=A0A813V6L8_9BILA|nr:unnamed protein product [Brachionus calyciflorus]
MQNRDGDTNAEKHIFKVLYECGKDISRFKYFIFFIGTSLDNSKLRQKIHKIQQKLFENCKLQKEAILHAVKKSTDRNDTDRLICYTLSILTYFELLMKRLNILVRNFPPDNVCLVNLDVDELLDVDTDEVTILNEVTNEPSLFELKDNYESHIEMIRTLREQVEQLDVNLGRYNVRQESSDFIGKINEFNEDKDQEQNLTNRKNSNKSTTRTPINISKNNKQIKNSKLKEICNRRKFLCTIVIIIVICVIIIAIVCGLVFGLRKT